MARYQGHTFHPESTGASLSLQSSSPSLWNLNSPMYGATDTSSFALSSLSSLPVVGSLFGGAAKHQQDRYDKQWQEYMTKLGFAFADDQRLRQNLWNYGVSKYFMDTQNEWNSYENQSKEMRKAGLNPAMMFGQGQLSGNNSSQSAPTGGYSTSGIASQGSLASSLGNQDFAQSLKALGEAKKLGIETDYLEEQLQLEIEDKTLRNEYQKIINFYQSEISYQQVVQAIRTNEKIYREIDNLIKEGNLKDAQRLLANAQERVAKEMEGKTKAEREFAEEIASRRQELVQADLEEKVSKASVNQSQAHNLDVQSDMLPRQVAAQEKGAAAAWLSANASMLSAEAQDYLAKHPNDIEGFLVKAFQGAFGSAEKFGAWLAAKLGLSFDDAEDVERRVKRTGQVPVWFKKRVFDFDPNNLHLQ